MEGASNNLFKYNDLNSKWECFHRDDYKNYWNDRGAIAIGIGYSPETAFYNWRTKDLNY
jgi:hypothetical protein